MSDVKGKLIRIWAGIDHLLLAAVFVLLGVWSYSTWQRPVSPEGEGHNLTQDQRSNGPGVRPRPSSSRAVEGLRVSLENNRMMSIARSMANTAWERVPAAPAMDMREDGKSYEIYFALPDGVDPADVRVSTQGCILTLAMASESDGAMMVQRFRVPCILDREKNIETAVSNSVLCVRIRSSLNEP